MRPSVGRIVHYQTYGTPGGEHAPEPIAAIITKVHDIQTQEGELVAADVVDLFAIYPNSTSHKSGVLHASDDAPTPGMWNWPPRVEAATAHSHGGHTHAPGDWNLPPRVEG